MRQLLHTWAAAVLIGLISTIGPTNAAERVLLFISDVQIARNGDLSVTETIRVQAEGQEIRRGIIREFTTVYARPDGTRVEVDFDVQLVTRDGSAEQFATERTSNGVRVRIGSADRFLSNGPHEYVIRYRTTRQVGYFSGFDELYWNVTGTGWSFEIEAAEARITLPERTPFLRSAVYTGPLGARGTDAMIVQQEPGHIVFRTTKLLPPRNGLTVAASWAKGVVDTPDAAARKVLRASFISQFSVQAWANQDTLVANPFPYKDKVVGVRADFEQMISPTEARFGRMLVSDVPSTRFTTSNRPMVLAFTVTGAKPFMYFGTNVSLPYGRFAGVHFCTQSDCEDFFDK